MSELDDLLDDYQRKGHSQHVGEGLPNEGKE
jgi:hypothetical protein